MQVRPHELIGVQRDKAWNDIILARAPEVAKYAQRAGRTIPVALLGTRPRSTSLSSRD